MPPVHAIMLFAKKGSLFFFSSVRFFFPPCYTCHHFHGSRVGKFISVSVTICMMMCLLKASFFTVEARMQIEPPKKHFVVCQNSSSKGEKLLPKSCKRQLRILPCMHCIYWSICDIYFTPRDHKNQSFFTLENLRSLERNWYVKKKSYLHPFARAFQFRSFSHNHVRNFLGYVTSLKAAEDFWGQSCHPDFKVHIFCKR